MDSDLTPLPRGVAETLLRAGEDLVLLSQVQQLRQEYAEAAEGWERCKAECDALRAEQAGSTPDEALREALAELVRLHRLYRPRMDVPSRMGSRPPRSCHTIGEPVGWIVDYLLREGRDTRGREFHWSEDRARESYAAWQYNPRAQPRIYPVVTEQAGSPADYAAWLAACEASEQPFDWRSREAFELARRARASGEESGEEKGTAGGKSGDLS